MGVYTCRINVQNYCWVFLCNSLIRLNRRGSNKPGMSWKVQKQPDFSLWTSDTTWYSCCYRLINCTVFHCYKIQKNVTTKTPYVQVNSSKGHWKFQTVYLEGYLIDIWPICPSSLIPLVVSEEGIKILFWWSDILNEGAIRILNSSNWHRG